MAGITITYALKTSEQEKVDKTGKYTYSQDRGIQELKVEEAKKHFKDVFVFEDDEDKTIYIEGNASAFQCIRDLRLYPLFEDPGLFIRRKRGGDSSSYGSILAEDFLEALKVVEGLIRTRNFSPYKGLGSYALSLFLRPYISHLIRVLSRNLEAKVFIVYDGKRADRDGDEFNRDENAIEAGPEAINVRANALLQEEIEANGIQWADLNAFDVGGLNIRMVDMNDINI